MMKMDEFCQSESCLNKARQYEYLFVIRAHDITAPAVVRFWIAERIRTAKNNPGDPQLIEAEHCALAMERQNQEGI